MNGWIRKSALSVCLGSGVAALGGCVSLYRDCVDPCWPERYNYMARQSVREAFNAQAANGHVLDQTIWNQHFEMGTDRLNEAGKAHLKYIARRLPAPDPHVFVQPAYDIEGVIVDPDALKALNEKRVVVVQRYLAGMMALRNMPITFEVAVRDAAEPGLPSRAASNLYVVPLPAPNKTDFQIEREALQRAGAPDVDVTTVQQQETDKKVPAPTTPPPQ